MIPRGLALSVIASAFCGCLFAFPARAHPTGFLDPPGARLKAGDVVSVRRTAEVGESHDFDEMELVLSLDGGVTFPLRVTREISPTSETVQWTVPRLPAAHARLALRAGRRGSRGSEGIELLSPEFSIFMVPGEPLEPVFRSGDEWRTREALESREDLPASEVFDHRAEDLRAGFPSERDAERPESFPSSTRPARREIAQKVAGFADGPEELLRSFVTFSTPLRR